MKLIKIGNGKGCLINKTEQEFIGEGEEVIEVDKKLDIIDGKRCLIITKAEE